MNNLIRPIFFMDKSIFLVLMARVFNSFSGLISIFFIVRYLSTSQQGHYYAFTNLIGFSVFFEFGLSTLIIQLVSHALVSSKVSSIDFLKLTDQNKNFFGLLKNITSFSFMLALLMFVGMFLVGLFIFASSPSLFLPWILLIFLTSLNFLMNTYLNIIEGSGKIIEVVKIRFFAMLISAPILWLCFSLGFNVYALSIQLAISIFVIWLNLKYKELFIEAFKIKSFNKFIDFFREIIPLQAKLTVSFFSNYMNFQGFIPLIYLMFSPEYAGKFGITLQVITAINGFGITWVNTKFSYLSNLAAKNSKVMQLEFKKLFLVSTGVLLVLLMVFLAVIFYLQSINSIYIHRLLNFESIIFLCAISFAIHVYSAINIFLLSFKKDPLFELNLLKIIFLFGGVAWIFSSQRYGDFLYLYFLSAIFISLFGSIYVFCRHKKKKVLTG
jgi:O-antigen/teichoic acid export membrane protein